MNKTLATQTALIIFIVVIFGFVGTFWMFLDFKERVCKINLNSTACGERFVVYLQNAVHGGSW